MRAEDGVLKEFLIEAGIINRGQLEEALRHAQDKPLSLALIESGVLGEEEVRRAASHALGVPFIVLDPHDIALDPMVLIPEPPSRVHSVVACAIGPEEVEVALLDLADLEALAPLEEAGVFGSRRLLPRRTSRES